MWFFCRVELNRRRFSEVCVRGNKGDSGELQEINWYGTTDYFEFGCCFFFRKETGRSGLIWHHGFLPPRLFDELWKMGLPFVVGYDLAFDLIYLYFFM